MKMTMLLSLLIAFFVSSCGTVTIRDQGIDRLSTEPTYQSTKDFYWWGISGEHSVDVKEICQGQTPRQIQSQFTASDVGFAIITLGIYHPRTVKIWCK